MPDYIIRQRDRGQTEAKTSRPRPRPTLWPRGLNITGSCNYFNSWPWSTWPDRNRSFSMLFSSVSLGG